MTIATIGTTIALAIIATIGSTIEEATITGGK